MPVRTRHGPSTGSEAADPEEAPGQLRGLKFNQPLSWRVGRPAIPIADLLERLQTLAHELRKLEQEEVDKGSLRKVSQELATGHLLGHKDKGVRAWATCCLVDVLRLCAPDAPFTGNQLKDIFTCIITSIIPTLADPSNAYNAQHVYVLNSLAEVKSIVLMTDLDHPDSLIIPLFAACFDIVSGSSKASTGEQVAKNVEFDMTRMLVTVIDETPVLAPEVVDIIVAQFLRVDPRALEPPNKKGKKAETPHDARQDTLLLKDYPAAYNMAKSICQACPERMTSHISQYFNNVIVDSSKPQSRGRDSLSKHSHRRAHPDDSDEETEDIKELGKAHRLIRELWRACPEVLQNVVPQLEAELSAESVPLRLLATQTIGDLAAGIGVAGPPPPPPMDPARYPPVTLTDYSQTVPEPSVLLIPLSPKPFSQVHASAYDNFLSRHLDKSASVRAAWVTVVGRILLTSAGGCGLSENEEQSLLKSIAASLRDADEKVRVAAADAVGGFGLSDIVQKLSPNGGLSSPNSVLSALAERVKDRKTQVREHAIKILARIWGVAAGEIEQQNEQVASLLKDAPSRILDAYYTNDTEIHVLVDRVLFELLLPLSYPPIKPKSSSTGKSSQSQKQKDGHDFEGESDGEADVDRIRVRRILTLLASLDDKAKKVFFAMQHRQLTMRTVITVYLQHCEAYNGGVIENDESRIKSELGGVINSLTKIFPDPPRASADLWKFAKVHDRRSYQLIRFAMAANNDYRTVTKAIRELTRRAQAANNAPLLGTLIPTLYRCSSLVFNRSHIPAIMSISRSDENGLANSAHELLKEISSRNPEVLEAQVQEMCKDLETQAPKATGATTSTKDVGIEEILKACSGFAKRLPSKLPKDRKFLQALANYALYSPSPRAAKHAVTILMVAADRKEMYARDLVRNCVTKWKYGSNHFLTRLAALSQLNLLAPREADEESDVIITIAANEILLTNRSPEPDSQYAWSEEVVEETAAKEWALRIVVNRLRAKEGSDNDDDFRAHANPVYSTLVKLITEYGELSKKKDTPAAQKSRLRLLAAQLLLKLCASKSLCEQLFSPENFNSVSLVAQDPLLPVRSGFINQLIKKLMAQETHLSNRWYTIPFLLAFEPNAKLKSGTFTWLRARATFFSQHNQVASRKGEQQTIMESVFSRLLSLLAYHPDYPSSESDEKTRNGELADLARYILFYLSAVGNEHNLSLIFHIAQRVKQVRDGITKTDEATNRLHTLSDLAQATIRHFADTYSQLHKFGGGGAAGSTNILQTYPGKLGIPSSIFSAMGSHHEAQEVAGKNFLPDEVDDLLDEIVRSTMKPSKSGTQGGGHGGQTKKRKSGPTETNGATSSTANAPKKFKKEGGEKPTTTTRPRKTSSATATAGPGSSRTGTRQQKKRKKRKENEGEWSSGGEGAGGAREISTTTASRRRSSRGTGKKGVSYVDRDSDEDDIEMQEWDQTAEKKRVERTTGEDDDDDVEDEGEEEEGEEEEEEAPVFAAQEKEENNETKEGKNEKEQADGDEPEEEEETREIDRVEIADTNDSEQQPDVSRRQRSAATKTTRSTPATTKKTATTDKDKKKKKAEAALPTPKRSSRRNR